MIHQIKAQLEKACIQNSRKSRVDNLVSDLVLICQMAYAIEDNFPSGISQNLINDVQDVLCKYYDEIKSYEPEKKAE